MRRSAASSAKPESATPATAVLPRPTCAGSHRGRSSPMPSGTFPRTSASTIDPSQLDVEPGRASDLGGAEGTRTPDPLVANEVRYQLRYSPWWNSEVTKRAGSVVHRATGDDRVQLVVGVRPRRRPEPTCSPHRPRLGVLVERLPSTRAPGSWASDQARPGQVDRRSRRGAIGLLTYVGSGTGTGCQPAALGGPALLGLAARAGRPPRRRPSAASSAARSSAMLAPDRHQPVQRVEAGQPRAHAAAGRPCRVRVTSRLRRTCTRRCTRSATRDAEQQHRHPPGHRRQRREGAHEQRHQQQRRPGSGAGASPRPRPRRRTGADRCGRDPAAGRQGRWRRLRARAASRRTACPGWPRGGTGSASRGRTSPPSATRRAPRGAQPARDEVGSPHPDDDRVDDPAPHAQNGRAAGALRQRT